MVSLLPVDYKKYIDHVTVDIDRSLLNNLSLDVESFVLDARDNIYT
jgi:hypothetical protein